MFLNKQTIIKQLGISNNFFRRIIKESSNRGLWHKLQKYSEVDSEFKFDIDIILKMIRADSFSNQRLPIELDLETQSHLNYLIDK